MQRVDQMRISRRLLKECDENKNDLFHLFYQLLPLDFLLMCKAASHAN